MTTGNGTILQIFALSCTLAACGTTAGPGGGSDNAPVSGAGPFRRIDEAYASASITPPFVLTALDADLDDPFVLADGEHLSLWATARGKSSTDVVRADATRLADGFGDPRPALADASSPSVLPGAPWLMLFATADGAVGWATSPDGESWTRAAATFGAHVASPTAVRLDDRVRVYFLDGGALFAAEAPAADLAGGGAVAWTRLDGPLLAPSSLPLGVGLGKCFARAATTPADRVRHDLYLTLATGVATTPTEIGFASSWDGLSYEVAPATIVATPPAARAPTETPLDAGAALLFVQSDGGHDGIAAALSP